MVMRLKRAGGKPKPSGSNVRHAPALSHADPEAPPAHARTVGGGRVGGGGAWPRTNRPLDPRTQRGGGVRGRAAAAWRSLCCVGRRHRNAPTGAAAGGGDRRRGDAWLARCRYHAPLPPTVRDPIAPRRPRPPYPSALPPLRPGRAHTTGGVVARACPAFVDSRGRRGGGRGSGEPRARGAKHTARCNTPVDSKVDPTCSGSNRQPPLSLFTRRRPPYEP